MWPPQQKVQCMLWLTEFKSVTRVQRRIRTEWNVVTGLPNRLTRAPTKGITHTIKILSPWWIDLDVGGSAFHSVRTRRCTRVTDKIPLTKARTAPFAAASTSLLMNSKSLGFGIVEDQCRDGQTQWRDYKRENMENKSKQEVNMGKSSKEDTGPQGAVLPE
ncbi:uncharacterized protein TNCV_1674361 [Trichonephila clavipes]|nr:uncharacterized protein TNCV_1674361 [Trichonephila clavipes]